MSYHYWYFYIPHHALGDSGGGGGWLAIIDWQAVRDANGVLSLSV